jgi:hypothetical protein
VAIIAEAGNAQMKPLVGQVPAGTRFSNAFAEFGSKRAVDFETKFVDHGDHATVTGKKFCCSGALLALLVPIVALAVANPTAQIATLATNKLFELAGTRSTLGQHTLDRHWRNARTHILHVPVRWKYAIVGNTYLNGVNPPLHAWS